MRTLVSSLLCAGTLLIFTLPQFEATQNTDCKCENGKCVADYRGITKCICKPKYVLQTEGVCKECDCGNNGKCYFERQLSRYLKKCLCDRGYAEKDGTCINCRCGENSKCEFEGDNKICYCLEGYADLNGVCTECDCGEFGECEFRNGRKHCLCAQNYLEHNGKCKECDCGNGDCSFQGDRKVCKCRPGYSLKGGRCEACDCGANSQGCNFDGTGRKVCACRGGYAQRNGQCSVCNCGQNAYSCSFGQDGSEVCRCKPGFGQRGRNTCEVSCINDNECKNGGKCVSEGRFGAKFCKCGKGVKGDKCELVVDCNEEMELLCRGAGGVCSYHEQKQKPYCKCPEKKVFNPFSKMCELGPCKVTTCFGGRCERHDGELLCICPKGYRLEGVGCHGIMCQHKKCYGGVCRVHKQEEICNCFKGYVLKNDICVLDPARNSTL